MKKQLVFGTLDSETVNATTARSKWDRDWLSEATDSRTQEAGGVHEAVTGGQPLLEGSEERTLSGARSYQKLEGAARSTE